MRLPNWIENLFPPRVCVGNSMIPVLDVPAQVELPGPYSFEDLVGQHMALRALRVKLDASSALGEAPSHMLFTGGSGLGKTVTARVFSRALGTTMHYVMCPELTSWSPAADLLRSIQPRDVLFLDEIHALRPAFQEKLYQVLADFVLDGKPVERFVAIGATTHAGRLNRALKSRMAQEIIFEPYSVPELAEIARRHARRKYQVELPLTIALSLGKLSKREARRAVSLTDALVESSAALSRRRPTSADLSAEAFALMVECANIDPVLGLDSASRRYLRALCSHGRPASAETLAKLIGEEVDNVKHHIEPFLMSGMPEFGGPLVEIIAPHGRRLTAAGMEYVGSNPDKDVSLA